MTEGVEAGRGVVDDSPRTVVVRRTPGDRLYRGISLGAGSLTLVLLVLIGAFLLIRAFPALRIAKLSFLTQTQWLPDVPHPKFGIAAIMYWTGVIAVIALVMAVPVALAASLYITEYAPRRLRRLLTSMVDLLAAVPSLIYGLWGFFYLQPRLVGISRWLSDHFGFIPFFKTSRPTFTSSAFIAGVVVALMIVPICTAVMREVFTQAPPSEKEGALALGATRWGMIRTVVLPFGRGGIIGGSMLGLGRALGETIAVAIIISPIFTISPHVLESGANSVASLIALRFGEAKANGLAALMAAGLALFIVTLIVNTIASVIVSRSRSGAGVDI
jgi:phosphate transport system permease protein